VWLLGRARRLALAPGAPGVAADGLLPARYETHDRLMAQIRGRRRVLLLNPLQVRAGCDLLAGVLAGGRNQ
jgi:hypothetical protein